MTNKLYQFVRGMGSVVDIGAAFANSDTRVGRGLDVGRTDMQALSGDWQKLTEDFGAAFEKTVRRVGEHGKSE